MNSPTKIKAVTFDVGGTLISPWPSVGHVYAEIATQHGFSKISAEQLTERFQTAWRASKNFDYTRAGWEELVNETFRTLIPDSAEVTFFYELYDRFAQADAWRVFEDVRPTLENLASAELRLGVISNWDERLRVLLRRLRLEKFFETITISCEVGFPKPSRVIFEQAASKLGVASENILHVGDSSEMDFRGAKSAGFQALLLRRNEQKAGSKEIHSLSELPDCIISSN
jgi:putative hydrolase of the HAD superfamily